MQTSNISVLLNAAEYVRTETIINGNAANYLDCTIKAIRGYIADIEEATAKIEDLEAAGKERGVNMASRRLDRDKKDLAELVEQLRGWLMEYKKNHPNVKISIETEPTTEEETIISLPKYYTETPERLRLLARNMADQYRGLNDPEAKRMKAIYLDIAGAPEYFLKNNLIKAI